MSESVLLLQILTSFNKLKIMSEVVLLLPNTDLLQDVEDYVLSLRRCKVIHFYGQPSETWITHLQDDTMSLGYMVIEQQTQSRKFDVNVTKWTVKWAHDQVSSSSHAGVICMSGWHVLTVINVWTKHDEHNYRLWGIRETDLIMKTWRKVSNVTRPWKLD